jgi:hypothetical protein
MRVTGNPSAQQKEWQWQCPICGDWVANVWWRHAHVTPRELTLEEMRALRAAGGTEIVGSNIDIYHRQGGDPKHGGELKRIKPSE